MNTKLTEREKLDEVLDLIRAAYGKNYEEYKVIGRKLIVPDNSKTYSRVFDIPSVLAGMTRSRKGRSTFGFFIPRGRISYLPYNELCLSLLEEYNTEKIRKNYAAEKKKEDLKNKEFGVYKPGGIYYTSYGYDETHYCFYICNKIVGQTIYLQKLGKIVQDLPGCRGQYQNSRPDINSKIGEEFTRRIVFVNSYYKQNWQVMVDRDILSPVNPEEWHCETGPYGGR